MSFQGVAEFARQTSCRRTRLTVFFTRLSSFFFICVFYTRLSSFFFICVLFARLVWFRIYCRLVVS